MTNNFSTKIRIPLLKTIKSPIEDQDTPNFIKENVESPKASYDSTFDHSQISFKVTAEKLMTVEKPAVSVIKPQAQRVEPNLFGFQKLYGAPFNYQKTAEDHCMKKIYFNNMIAKLVRLQAERKRYERTCQINKDNFFMRLQEIARNFCDQFVVLRPSKNTNFGQWGQRVYSRNDIDKIIYQSKLVLPKQQIATVTCPRPEFQKSPDLTLETTQTKEKQQVPVISGNTCVTESQTNNNYSQLPQKIGGYTLNERRMKLLQYKTKQIKRRQRVTISRGFKGRSMVACNKVRINGKFVKKAVLEAMQAHIEV